MNYRWQETIKILIPGFYLTICMLVCLLVADNPLGNGLYLVAEKLSVYVLVLLLFVAFIVGFVNEVVSGEIEYLMYRLGVPRPSLLILKNVFCRYCVYDISKLKEKLSIDHDERINNEKAATCLRKAKQSIDMEICKELYYQSVLSRNLFVAHLIVAFLILIFVSFSFKILFFLLVLSVLLGWQWWKMNMVYVKNIFVEFLRSKD